MQVKACNEFNLLSQSGWQVYERLVEFPLWDEYAEFLKSEIADMKNLGPPEAGAITAGKFLEKFAESPLIHLDIAGTQNSKKDNYYMLKHGSAAGLRLLAEFLRRLAADYTEKKQ